MTVAESIADGLSPVRQRFAEIMKDEGYVEEVARKGGLKASESAEATMVKVREALSLEKPAV